VNKALLDTDILSEVAKAIDPTVTRHAAAYRQAHGFLTLSVISVMEVIQGYHRVGAARRIQAFRNAIAAEEVLPFDQATADLAGHIAGDLDRVGRPIGRCDPMIAAVALGAWPGAGDRQHRPLPAHPAAGLSPHPDQLADSLTPTDARRGK
jgi:predicted nucleic acid-binding protein